MTMNAFMAIGHFLAVFFLIAALAMEWAWLRGRVDAASIRRLLRADALYGLSALAVLIFGLMRVMGFEKSPDYYQHALPFWIKLGLFGLIALLSIKPTVAIINAWRVTRINPGFVIESGQVDGLRRHVALELSLLPPLFVAASLMAKGVGYFG